MTTAKHQAKIRFRVDGFTDPNPQEAWVDCIINPTDDEYESYKRGNISGLALLAQRGNNTLWAVMPVYAVNSGYSSVTQINTREKASV